ncbi:HIT family protein [Streptomyces sp. NBC_00483]|uniref:HIT family protein n=1 Tax=Streptomyces sp. NBC_00483 TaxID=2975756 RepID=UPI002E188B93
MGGRGQGWLGTVCWGCGLGVDEACSDGRGLALLLAAGQSPNLEPEYDCAGVSTRQQNEPAGGQTVWHFHQHLFPRYPGDDLYASAPQPDALPAERRRAYAERLRAALKS